MTSPFNWRNQPSTVAEKRTRNVVANPNSLKFHSSTLSGSIATPEKLKQRPGTGRSATA